MAGLVIDYKYSSWPTIPQVFIKGNFIGGCDIMQEMHLKGELRDLLKKEGLIDNSSEHGDSK